ncbi:STAS domain-containing protein [Actinomycetospora flava]|uniref:STAS domain-containing protein n=1 Tax=Actinomycetospora flava TaxID=3129232 RepID=A0ABU8M8P4_9PSEU
MWAAGEEVVVLRGEGELDLVTRPEVHSTVARALGERPGPPPERAAPAPALVIDIGAATYLGATVVAALVEEAERRPATRTPRLVVGRCGPAARVAAILDLTEAFDVFADLHEAMGGGDAQPRREEGP